jgi:radical SAM protein with 4Fe4S-binding SPASM domain
MGEPLLNKDFLSMIQIGRQKQIDISFTTNGSLLMGKLATQIADHIDSTIIHISLDGASAEVFESIRVGSNFKAVCKNVQEFVSTLSIKDRSRITAWMVLTQKNLHEVEDVVQLVKQLGIGSLTLQPFLNDWGKREMQEYINETRIDPEWVTSKAIHKKLEKAKKIAKENSISLRIFEGDFYSKTRKCSWPWKSAYICTNGDVVPCPILADSDTVKMGNIFEEDFPDIWNSDQYQAFRRSHVKHRLHEYCKHCYLDA